jgi:Ni/Co efflux regulator RcnB
MKKLLTAAIAVSIMGSAGVAIAQPQHSQGGYDQRNDRHDDRADRKDERRADKYERRAERRYKAARYQAPRGYQARQWRYGERLPVTYRSRGYVVDYRPYRLAPPPRGYQYVRVGNDVMLVSTTDGMIASVIQQLFQ